MHTISLSYTLLQEAYQKLEDTQLALIIRQQDAIQKKLESYLQTQKQLESSLRSHFDAQLDSIRFLLKYFMISSHSSLLKS